MMQFKTIINIGLRGLTLLTRFFFIFFLAHYLEPMKLGLYGLFTAAIGYSLYFVGLDFYTYSTREIVKEDLVHRGRILKGQFLLSFVLYLIFIPIIACIFQFGVLPKELYKWFIPILISEHLNQEIMRLLIVLSKPIMASFILFIRQGSWALWVVFVMVLDPKNQTLSFVFCSWFIAGFLAFLMGGYSIYRLNMGGWKEKVDLQWIKKGIITSVAFLMATLALRAILVVDRYWLEYLTDMNTLAAYVLFMGIAATLSVFLDAGLFSFIYPELIKHALRNEYNLFYKKVKIMLNKALIVCIGFGVVSFMLLPYLLHWIGKDLYINLSYIYPWLFAAMVLSVLSMVPHYALYAQQQDKVIIHSHIIGLILFVVTTMLVSYIFPQLAVLLGINVSFAGILILKSWGYIKINRSKETANKNQLAILKG